MKAIVYTEYGPPDVLQLKEVEKPTPKNNEVLIKIRATTVSSADWRARSLIIPYGFGLISRLVFGVMRPRKSILGSAFAGEIESVGKDVTKFKIGDQVFGATGAGFGCHAQYKSLPEDGAVTQKLPNLTFEEAAAISFGGTTALVFLRNRGKIQSGEKIIIIGASGAVGSAAVQLAKHFGAEVTGVCSATNFELVKSLGADKVIDYTKEDFAQNDKTYDIIMDTVGTTTFSRIKNSLNERGRLLLVVAGLPELALIPWVLITTNKKVIAGPVNEHAEDLRYLAELNEAGIFKPVIDRTYSLEQTAEAHAYVDKGHKKGNVVITVDHNSKT